MLMVGGCSMREFGAVSKRIGDVVEFDECTEKDPVRCSTR